VEQSRTALINAMAGLAQSIPQIAAMGGDPTLPVAQMAKFIDLQLKGKTVEDAAMEAFAPQAPPPAPPGPEGATPSGEGGPPGFSDAGLPSGLQPGLAAEGPQGRPDLAQVFAGITQSGAANLSATTSRMAPVAQ